MDDEINNTNDSVEIERMRLGKFEFRAMNNMLRQFVQKYLEFKTFRMFLKKYNINLKNEVIIDAGCGSGYSSELIMKEFGPKKIIAFDIMPEQIEIAKSRSIDIDFSVGDVTHIKAQGQTVKSIFVFGVIHHVPKWKEAVKEFARVLVSGGVVLIEEPLHDNMYTWREFENEFGKVGLKLLERKNLLFNYFRSYMFKKD